MNIRLDDLRGPAIAAFLQAHLDDIAPTAPAASRHALDLAGLRQPGIRFWTAWMGDQVAACAALKLLSAEHVELKSMRTAPHLRGQGVASALLTYVLDEARNSGHQRVSLETGSMVFFHAAHALYRRHGFLDCEPFGDYRPDANSLFMTRAL